MPKVIYDPFLGTVRLSDAGTSSGVMEEVIISLAGWTSISVEGGKRYVLTPNEIIDGVEKLDITSVEKSSLESEIVFSTSANFFTEVAFPATLDTIPEEPSFEAGKSYIINIRNNCAVCAAYKPGATA